MGTPSSPGLDAARDRVRRLADAVLPAGPRRELLRGTWLGHPLHPMLTDLPIGFWTSAMVLDLLRRDPEAARLLIALGVVSAVPTMAAGLADWTALSEAGAERTGVLHAGANGLAVALYGASWLLRARGRERTGIAVSFVAGSAATIAGFLGGELAFPPAQPSEDEAPRAREQGPERRGRWFQPARAGQRFEPPVTDRIGGDDDREHLPGPAPGGP